MKTNSLLFILEVCNIAVLLLFLRGYYRRCRNRARTNRRIRDVINAAVSGRN